MEVDFFVGRNVDLTAKCRELPVPPGMDTRPGMRFFAQKSHPHELQGFNLFCVCVPYGFSEILMQFEGGLVPLNDLREVEEAPRSDCRCGGLLGNGGMIFSSCTHHWKSKF